MSKICVVTGGGGFLGRALVTALVARGHEVRALDVGFPAGWSVSARLLQGDICDPDLLRQVCRGADWVFHLAALLPQRRAPVAEMRRVNVEGTRGLLRAGLEEGVQRVVMVSSAEVYGVPSVAPCPEDAPLQPLGEYGRNKVEAEQLVKDAFTEGLGVVILRPPTVVGEELTEPVLLATMAALRKGLPILIPAGPGRFQMVALSDLVDACLAATQGEGPLGEAFNIASQNVPSQLATFRGLRDRVGSRSAVVAVPRPLLRVILNALLALGISPLEPEHVAITLADYVFDIRKARERLGWHPAKGNVEALADAYRWSAGGQ